MADMASELEAVAFRLRRAGQGGLERELTAAMRRAVAPVPGQIRGDLDAHLPNRYAGDLNADLDIKTIARSNGVTDAVVSVYAQSRGGVRKLKNLDRGLLTHPLFGDREHWYTQGAPSVRPGWFTGTCQAAGPRVRAELEKALDGVAAKAAG